MHHFRFWPLSRLTVVVAVAMLVFAPALQAQNGTITGQVTVANRPGSDEQTGLYRRRKDRSDCTGDVFISDLSGYPALNCNGGAPIPQTRLDDWNGQIQTGLDTLNVPPLRSFEPGGEYWTKADLRVVGGMAALLRTAIGDATGMASLRFTIAPNDTSSSSSSAVSRLPP